MPEAISFRLNGKPVSVNAAPDRALLWVLRTDLGVTGPKYGCGIAQCGSCTVLVDNRAVRSCSVEARSVQGAEVTTIEGLERDGRLHPIQEAFVAHDALQCGFCTPGMILTACDLLRRRPNPTREEVVAGMDDNLCRCGAHTRIVDAVMDAAAAMRGGTAP
jgi:aerobic-type carbon monoxide dehydrogenase small subunit (CoxS/CutS family)